MPLRVGKWLFGTAILATLAFPLLMGGIPAFGELTQLTVVDYLSIAIVIVFGWCARALKLRMLLRRLGTNVTAARMLRVALAADVGFLITPGGLGGYATSVYYLRRVGATTSGAVAVTSADQALDAIFFVIAVPLAAMRTTAVETPHPSLPTIISLACVCALVLIAALAWRKFRRGENRKTLLGFKLSQWTQRLRDFVHRWIADLRKLLTEDPILFCRVLMLSAAQQLCRYGALWLIFLLLGYPLLFARVLLGQTLVVQAAALTGIPAGGGVAELGLTAAFGDVLPPPAMAAALLLWRGATLYLGLVAGLGAIAWFAVDKPVTTTSSRNQDAPADRRPSCAE